MRHEGLDGGSVEPRQSGEAEGLKRTGWVAWLAIPVLVGAMGVLSCAGMRGTYESPRLLMGLNFVFSTLVSVIVAYLAGRSFVARGEGGLLMLGCGVLVWGMTSLMAVVAGYDDANTLTTIHNCGIWVAGVCHLGGVLFAKELDWRGRARGVWLGYGYGMAMWLVTVITLMAMKGHLPEFFVQGHGGTVVRQLVLGSAIGMFALTAGLLKGLPRSRFGDWYAMALVLLAAGLLGVLIQPSVGSPVGWVGRVAQYLGGAYMLVAVRMSRGKSEARGISLGEALRESEERFRSLFENSLDAMFMTEPNGTVLAANPAACAMFGMTEEELRRVGREGVVNPDESRLAGALAERERTGRCNTELTWRRKDGTIFPAEVQSVVVGGEGKRAFVILRDITERKRAEEVRSRLAAIVESSADAIIGKTLEGIIISWNQGAERIFGYTAGEVVGRLITMLIPPELQDEESNIQEHLRRGEAVEHFQTVRIAKDGRRIDVSLTISPIRDSRGEIIGISKIARDITEQKRAEEALRKQEGQLRLFVENAPAALAMFDTEMRYVAASNRWLEDFGLGGQELRGRSHYEVFPEIPEHWKEINRRCLAGAVERNEEDGFRRADGSVQWLRWEVRPWLDSAGAVGGIIILSEDVTARKQAREVMTRYQLITQYARDPLLLLSLEGRIVEANQAAEDLYGYSREELLGMGLSSLRSHDDAETIQGQIRQAVAGGILFETVHVRKDGVGVPVEVSSRGVVVDGQQMLLSLVRDITERKRAEEALRESEERYRLLAENTEDFVELSDVDRHVLYISPSFERRIGLKAADITPDCGLVSHEEMETTVNPAYARNLAGESTTIEYRNRCKDGSWIWLEGRCTPIRGADGRVEKLLLVSRDITERKRVEEALRAQRELLETVIHHLPAGIDIIRGSDLRLQLVNPAYQAIAPGKQMVGKTLEELWPETGRTYADLCRRVLETGEPYRAVDELNMIRRSPEGPLEPAYFTWSLFRVRLPGDEGWGILNTSWETTERKRAEEALRESERMYRAIGESIDYGIWICDAQGRNTYASESFLKLLGITQEQCAEFGWGDVLHPDDVEATMAAWKECVAGGGPWYREHRYRGADGQWHPILACGVAVRDEGGAISHWVGINLDIGRLKRAEEAKEAAHRQLQNVIDNTTATIYAFDLEERFVMANTTLAELLCSTPEQMIGKRRHEFMPKDDADWHEANDRKVIEAGRAIEFEEYSQLKGRSITWLTTKFPLRDAQGRIYAVAGISSDVSERKKAEEAMAAARAEAEEASRAKDRFIAVLSHELRTPLTPVLTMVQMMEADKRIPTEDRESLEIIRRNVELEVRLIDDLLDLTRISRGKMALHMVPVDLHDIQKRVVQICQGEVQSKQLALTMEWDAREHHVQGDPARLQQVLWNLLKNAVKFTPPRGSITIRTENPSAGRVAITVTDTGVGIKPEVLARIFNAFEQGETARQFGGLGLGLAISRQIAEMHGGTLTASSEGKDRGASFRLELGTCARVKEKVDAQLTLFETRGSREKHERILLVEDHADTRRTMGRLLKSMGFEVRIVDTVAAALQFAEAEEFDAVVSDIGLPDGSGLDLMRQLQARRPTKGIALSGFGMDEDIRKSMEAGFVAHLIKPVDVDRLEKVLRELCGGGVSSQ